MASSWAVHRTQVDLSRPVIMGIVNVTPDSFSDGGEYFSVENATRHAHRLLKEGADILDIGGESTRPRATPVSDEDEIARVVPVIDRVRADSPHAIISIDTVKSRVAAAAIEAGAHIVNDVSGFRLDPRMAQLCARTGTGVVLMHSRGDVSSMATYAGADYEGDAMETVTRELRAQLDYALAAGVARESVVVDPGIGFSKRSEHSLRMLACLDRIVEWGWPVLVGVSRKRFIGELTGQSVPRERVFGSVGAAVSAFERGARVFRVHDVTATREALEVAAAIRSAGAA